MYCKKPLLLEMSNVDCRLSIPWKKHKKIHACATYCRCLRNLLPTLAQLIDDACVCYITYN